ncbi:MAG: hypothetical protein ACREGC_02475, partial [Minisyncoccia bacterium]
ANTNKSSNSGVTPTTIFPFKYTIKPDGYLYADVNGQDYLAEFTAWGGHGLAMAGGHVEGNNKSNFRVHILPAGKSVELQGNGNGKCDAGENCGATLADIKANELWYTANYPHMKLIAVEHDITQDTSPYIPGETPEWRLFFSFDGGLQLNLQHTGEMSPDLIKLIKDSGQSSILDTTKQTNLSKPVDIPDGIKLARPQIIAGMSQQVGGQTYYPAIAQTEWSIVASQPTSMAEDCEWKNYFTTNIQAKMQKVLDTELTKPLPYGFFVSASGGSTITAETASEGALCTSDSINTAGNFDHLSANNSFGYYQVNGSNHPLGDVFTVFPIHKDSAAYKANASKFVTSADFMFRHGNDVAGFAGNTHYNIVMKQGSTTYTMNDLVGQVVDLTTAQDTTSNDHFIVKIDRGDNGGANMPIGKYFGVRYKIEKDKLIVAWGDLA